MNSFQQTDYHPPSAFYFKVVLGESNETTDAFFQEVSGIASEFEVEAVVEGGENRFVHQRPKGVKHPNLELKRGIVPMTSPLIKWCNTIMENDFTKPIELKTVKIFLMNENQEPIRGWLFNSAFPVQYQFESFDSVKGEIVIEKIILSYAFSTRILT